MCNNWNNTGEAIWRKCQLGYTSERKIAAVLAVRMTGCPAQKREVTRRGKVKPFFYAELLTFNDNFIFEIVL
jgi:hypothetical protein